MVFICCKKSPIRATDKVASFGETLSSHLIEAIFIEHKLDVQRIDGRELIETSVQNNRQIINWSKTAENVQRLYGEQS